MKTIKYRILWLRWRRAFTAPTFGPQQCPLFTRHPHLIDRQTPRKAS